MEDIYKRVVEKIRTIRKELRMTQEEVAFKAGVNPTFISHHIERGTKKASLATVEKIADALGVPLHKLFSYPDEPVVYLKSEEELFAKRIEQLVKEKGEKYKRLLWRIARYLSEV